DYEIKRGYCYLRRVWQPGDTVALTFNLPIRRLHADPRVKDCAGKAALARGPVIYCFEQADQSVPVFFLHLPSDAEIVSCKELRDLPKSLIGLRMMGKANGKPHEITAIPYFAWANRTKGDMTVWINET
ncbi:MAG: glycoside hydrolase family 127 protein, partial [Lachnospiraceae bacterium]|nr:glycoside hydrolase family 127 protein [Lachnospiraceae bacterium]